MVEHERSTYSDCLEVTFPLRIAQHTSVYWGASALGQISIALAFGGCSVLCEVPEIEDFKRVIREEAVNTIGLVPDQLKLLAEDPSSELPNIQAVFSWGEKLPINVAQRWSNHPKARLRELLVSTEYWLSFYSAPLEGIGRHRIVGGVETLIIDQAEQDGTGELVIRGPMVTTGYIAGESSDSSFIDIDGKSYFRTRDLVQRWSDGTLEFRGRADMTMKQRGQWVDLSTLQGNLQEIKEIEDCQVVPDPGGSSTVHAFVVLKVAESLRVAEALRQVRKLLPHGQIHTLSSLPRHPVTCKVDYRKLTSLAKGSEESWPLNPSAAAEPFIIQRGKEKVLQILAWSLLALLGGFSWDLASVLRLKLPSGLGLLMLPYMHLSFLHTADERSRLSEVVFAASEVMPMGIWGSMVAVLMNRGMLTWLCEQQSVRSSQWMSACCKMRLMSNLLVGLWVSHGAAHALRRRRFLAYPLVFWTGIGYRLEYDLERYWEWYFTSSLQQCISMPFWLLQKLNPRSWIAPQEPEEIAEESQKEKEEAAEASDDETPKEPPLRCSLCCKTMRTAWPPPETAVLHSEDIDVVYGCNDRFGQLVCWACWPVATSEACKECQPLAESLLKNRPIAGPASEEENEQEQNGDAQNGNEQWSKDEKKQFDRWWWINKTVDYVELKDLATESAQMSTRVPSNPRERKIYRCLQDVLRTEMTEDMSFHALDSLTLGLLVGRLRGEFGVSLSISQLRNASPEDLPKLLEECEGQVQKAGTKEKHSSSDSEYAVWFSPGQYFPMGGWVLRRDGEICLDKLQKAAHEVTMRHDALRASPADPLRMLSFILDTAVMFTLVARLLDTRGPWSCRLRRYISWALKQTWPKIQVDRPEEVYGPGDFPSPLVVIPVPDQQNAEWHCKHRRGLLQESGRPVDIALIQLRVKLEGLWVYGVNGGMGDFAILPSPNSSSADAASSDLVLVDRNRREAAQLWGPESPGWIPPPYGFPALLSGKIESEDSSGEDAGGVIWLRLKGATHMSVLWRKHVSAKPRRYEAFRMPSAEVKDQIFNYLVVHAMHIIADGQSYEAIVGDLLAIYSGSRPAPPAVNSLELLQRRLFDSLDAVEPRNSPQMCSLRGSQWKCTKRGYGHILGFTKAVLVALRQAALRHAVPFDAALLALTAIAVANAKEVEDLEFTLYAPTRDGVGEAGLCGLFADWRVLNISLDKMTSTVLGVVQQVGHKIRTRQWGVYNAIKKPEATMVNFQLMDSADASSRAGFVQIGEELWRIGECMKEDKRNDEQLPRVPQPLSFVIEQGDKETWWLLINCAYDDYPPPVLRRMLKAFQDAAEAFVNKPTANAHISFPENFY
ncbi:unnamed protein product [Durusdinium trenchii]|uniref:Uncharacterized protein n=2 Tax=Durusdinium trenchii TaxID=1381693 RepID=A0ABP0IX01_9DINO